MAVCRPKTHAPQFVRKRLQSGRYDRAATKDLGADMRVDGPLVEFVLPHRDADCEIVLGVAQVGPLPFHGLIRKPCKAIVGARNHVSDDWAHQTTYAAEAAI